MARRSSSSKKVEGILLVFAAIAMALLAAFQGISGFLHKYWLPIAIFTAVMLFAWLIARLLSKPEGRSAIQGSPAKRREGDFPAAAPVTARPAKGSRPATEPVPVQPPSPSPRSFSIPRPTASTPRWVQHGESIRIRGFEIPDGMLYVGHDPGNPDASLIDPSLEVKASGLSSPMGYWPSYAGISPENRGAYLGWLAGGKSDPEVQIGYVFLYFYGLERRVLVDAESDASAAADIPLIEAELLRLLDAYPNNNSFRGYAGSLLGYIEAGRAAAGIPSDTPPSLAKSWEIPFGLKAGLARFVSQDAPIPGEWAYAWWVSDPAARLKTVAKRCPDEFKRLFIEYYSQKFKPGMRLRPNKTRLVAVHRVASPSLPRRQYERLLELPDVTVLTSPGKKLQEVADCCHLALDRYSRHIGRKPQNAGRLDALLDMPTLLWPDAMMRPLAKIHDMVVQSGIPLTVKFDRLLAMLPPWDSINKAGYSAFARSLAQIDLGIEPDPRYGGGVPGEGQTVALFAAEPSGLMAEPSRAFMTAAMSLQFAAAVSHADGDFDVREGESIAAHLRQWLHLGECEHARLDASLRRMAEEPAGLEGLRQRVGDMPMPAREALGDFLVLVAKADGKVTPQEVKLLERIFKMLGLDAGPLYGKLHAPASGPVTVRPGGGAGGGHAIPIHAAGGGDVPLDMGRVEGLLDDTRRASELLHAIFGDDAEEDAQHPRIPAETSSQPADGANAPGLLGLNPEYGEFARLLIGRVRWGRAELDELAADRGLLLDGILEHINEAAFDLYGQALAEDGDPIEINQDILGEITS